MIAARTVLLSLLVCGVRSAQLLGSPSFASDRAPAFMCSIVISVLSVLLDDQLLLLPSLTVVLRLISPDMAETMQSHSFIQAAVT